MLTELIEPGSADFARVERAVERAELGGPDAPLTLTARQVRGLLDAIRHYEDQSEEIEELKRERDDWEEEAAELQEVISRLESQAKLLQEAKAGSA